MVLLRVSDALGTLRQTTLVKPISASRKRWNRRRTLSADMIDFGDEVQGFVFNLQHVL
jgi:hypothetical protein